VETRSANGQIEGVSQQSSAEGYGARLCTMDSAVPLLEFRPDIRYEMLIVLLCFLHKTRVLDPCIADHQLCHQPLNFHHTLTINSATNP
jgi:hypothetical protein